MTVITTPTGTVQQVCSRTPEGNGSLLSLIAKRTYTVAPGGTLVPSEAQLPLSREPTPSRADSNLLTADIDVLPLKPRTDVIVHGHAHGDGKVRGLEIRLRVGRFEKKVMVVGPRRCTLSATGGIVVSQAEPFEKIPLSFTHAYGGRDRAAEAIHGNPLAALAPFLAGTGIDASNQSPYLYPRNPCGKGYLVEATPTAVDLVEMPNLEDPRDPLTPDRLVVGHPDRWIYMPMPQGLDWMSWGWFPRALFGGLRQDFAVENTPIPEVARGHVPQSLVHRTPEAVQENVLRFTNGAPIDLQLPHLAGDEDIEITHAHARERTWKIRLPGRPRRMSIDGREGKLIPTTPVLQTVLVEPDASRVVLVWCGTGPARRPYFPDELAKMPLLVEW